MAHRKKILVLESDQLLAASILSLLSSRSELDVMTTKDGTLASVNSIDGQQPDVVILGEQALADNVAALVELNNRQPNLRLIVLGLKDPRVHIFDKQMVEVGEVSDFLNLL